MARDKKWRAEFGGGELGRPRYVVITNGQYRSDPVYTVEGAGILLKVIAGVYSLDARIVSAMGWSIAFNNLPASPR